MTEDHGKSQVDSELDQSEIGDNWERLMGEDLQLKLINKPGPNAASVHAQDTVVITFIGRYAPDKNHKNGEVFQNEEEYWLTVGEKIALPALEMGVRFLNEGATGRVWAHSKFAYGPGYRKHNDFTLPSNANVSYDITVVKILPPSELSKPETLLLLGRAKKEVGNDSYKNEWASGHGKDRISYIYSKAAREMQDIASDESYPDNIRNQALEIFVDCLNNKAALQLRAKEFHASKETSIQVLGIDPNNFKALLRAAKASLMDPASDFDECKSALDAAAENCDDGNVDIMRLGAEFSRRKQRYDQQSKKMFAQSTLTPSKAKDDHVFNRGTRERKTTPTSESKKMNVLSKKESDSQKMRYVSYAFQLLMTVMIALILKQRRAEIDTRAGADDEL